MSPKMKKFFQTIAKIFKVKEKEIPENQDALGAYPLRMQISAIPERRYLRTARLLAVITFLNLAVLIALSGYFVKYAVKQDVSLNRRGQQQLFMMDPEYKVIQSAERNEARHLALEFVMEQAIRDYIKSRYTVYLDKQKQEKSMKYVNLYMQGNKLDEFYKHEYFTLTEPAKRKGVNREVHIYSLRKTPTGLWEALVDIFDMQPRDPYNPVCECDNNSRECLACKEELNLGRTRYRMYVKAGFYAPKTLSNPMGISISDIYVTPQIVHPKEDFWNIPSGLPLP